MFIRRAVHSVLTVTGLVIVAGLACALLQADAWADETASPAAPWAAYKDLYRRPNDVPYPADNPFSEAKARLGKVLFFDPRISRAGVISCATCHNPALDWTDGQARGVGDFHKPLLRKDPTLLNLAWDKLFFWDGRSESLESQAIEPIKSPHEMNLEPALLEERLRAIPGYRPLFAAAFPGEAEPIRTENVGKAIAIFERTIISGQAPFDRWIEGDETAIPEAAKRGFALFNTKARCASCHSGWNFSDGSFHDIGLKDDDIGRGKWVPLPAMQHAFKTMGLRNIARRYPYMHNGSMRTLEEVVDHYDHGFSKRESLSDQIVALNLDHQEKSDLIEFLATLTSVDEPVTIPQLPR